MDRQTELVATNILIPKAHKEMLSLLSRNTRITQSVYMREALADLLEKYKAEFKGTRFDPDRKKRGRKAAKKVKG